MCGLWRRFWRRPSRRFPISWIPVRSTEGPGGPGQDPHHSLSPPRPQGPTPVFSPPDPLSVVPAQPNLRFQAKFPAGLTGATGRKENRKQKALEVPFVSPLGKDGLIFAL